MRLTHLVIALCLAPVVAPALAHADRRSFSRTYEYQTMPEGETEVEIYSTWNRTTWADGAVEKHDLQLEFEHGLTDRWDVSLYHVFSQALGDAMTAIPMHLKEIKLRSRYRFAERGELPVDVLAYGELIRDFGASSYAAEVKAVLARDFGMVTVATNLVGEVGFGADVAETEVELAWAVGASYELSPTWKLGAESWGGFEPGEVDESLSAYAGPAVSWAPSTSLWVTTTAGFGLNDNSDKFSLRALIGLAL